MNIEAIREFFGWCVVFNFVFLMSTSILLLAFKNALSGLHAKLFGLDEKFVLQSYFRYVANLKIAFIVFALVPYIALHCMD